MVANLVGGFARRARGTRRDANMRQINSVSLLALTLILAVLMAGRLVDAAAWCGPGTDYSCLYNGIAGLSPTGSFDNDGTNCDKTSSTLQWRCLHAM